ncbi:hypothetical protein CDL15_Pgr026508 [Punica granatum]|uniref:Bifunctional inhibitor/plant lipid transfer protein/seed storage helical domain-containing protein n=1 Tax=Punica granatum TaxID=22663 RepID=A0A218WLQ7_PUNGR|nr:hypothetical protein CDL15_Pgr026508 [Punica granatum]
MASRRGAVPSRLVLVSVIAVVVIGSAKADLDQDRAECADQLVGLAGCLPYVGGDAKAPTIDCCSGLKQVLHKSKKCICVLIKDRDDPKLGLKINATLALGLPNACHAPANITQCIDLLHLDPKGTEAKIFKETNSSTTPGPTASTPAVANVNSTSNGTSDPANGSNGRKVNIGLVSGITCGAVIIWLFTSNLMFYV